MTMTPITSTTHRNQITQLSLNVKFVKFCSFQNADEKLNNERNIGHFQGEEKNCRQTSNKTQSRKAS